MHLTDPVPDISILVTELRQQDLFAQPASVVSYLVRFEADAATEAAGRQAAADGWTTSVFADADGCVLRLSREGAVTLQRLRQDKQYVRALALTHDGSWDAFSAETLEPASPWEMIAERLPEAIHEDDLAPAAVAIPSERRAPADDLTGRPARSERAHTAG